MTTTIADARTTLAAQITTAVATISNVTVLAFEPPTFTGNTITISTAGLTDTEIRLFIRVYVPAAQSEEGQQAVDDIVYTLDINPGLRQTPRTDWTWQYDSGRDIFAMQAVADYPRDDF